jgi:putative DNA primase/helicase
LVEKPFVVVDIDNPEHFKVIYNIIKQENIKCSVLKTERGGHFWFETHENIKNVINKPCALTIPIDVKCSGKKSTVTVKKNGVWRTWLEQTEQKDVLPYWLKPVKTTQRLFNMEDGDGRNAGLFSLILPLLECGFDKFQIKETLNLINKYVFKKKLLNREINAMIDENDIFENAKSLFFANNKFLHDKFAEWMFKTHKLYNKNNNLYIYDDNVYKIDYRLVEKKMIEQIPSLKTSQRKETMNYLELLDRNLDNLKDYQFVCKNGVYDLRKETLEPFNANIFFTNKINANFDYNAYDKNVDDVFSKLFPNEDLKKLIEEMLGYTLLRHVKYQKAFVLIGGGGNGKSTFINMIREFLGEDNCSSLSLEDTSHRFRGVGLIDKLVNLGDDISENLIDNTSNFKSLVTGDDIVFERKGKDAFSYKFLGKMIFTSNTIPSFRDKSDGILRRLIMIEFKRPFKPKSADYDSNILEKITSENAKSYLLNLAIKGAIRLEQQGSFTECEEVNMMYEEFKKDNNSIYNWVKSAEVNLLGLNSKETYLDYSVWCNSNGLKAQSAKKFYNYIRQEFKLDTIRTRVNDEVIRIWNTY